MFEVVNVEESGVLAEAAKREFKPTRISASPTHRSHIAGTAGYNTTNTILADITNAMANFAEVSSAQIAALVKARAADRAAAIEELAELAKANKQANKTPKTRNYCWTHGGNVGKAHTSATCNNKAKGHTKTKPQPTT